MATQDRMTPRNLYLYLVCLIMLLVVLFAALQLVRSAIGIAYPDTTGSFGWQIGAQSKAIILMFMTQEALDRFVNSNGWSVGADATVALARVGASGEIDTALARESVVGFALTNAGLMAGLTLEGSKITRLNM